MFFFLWCERKFVFKRRVTKMLTRTKKRQNTKTVKHHTAPNRPPWKCSETRAFRISYHSSFEFSRASSFSSLLAGLPLLSSSSGNVYEFISPLDRSTWKNNHKRKYIVVGCRVTSSTLVYLSFHISKGEKTNSHN